MANTFSKTEYHLTINKRLFEEMLKNPHVYDSSKLVHNEVIFDEGTTI